MTGVVPVALYDLQPVATVLLVNFPQKTLRMNGAHKEQANKILDCHHFQFSPIDLNENLVQEGELVEAPLHVHLDTLLLTLLFRSLPLAVLLPLLPPLHALQGLLRGAGIHVQIAVLVLPCGRPALVGGLPGDHLEAQDDIAFSGFQEGRTVKVCVGIGLRAEQENGLAHRSHGWLVLGRNIERVVDDDVDVVGLGEVGSQISAAQALLDGQLKNGFKFCYGLSHRKKTHRG